MNAYEFTKRERTAIVNAYNRGESSTKIADRYNVTANVILRFLRSEGVEIRRPGRYALA